MALSFDGVKEEKHHEIVSFKIKGKIFATLNAPMQRGCVRLSPVDQDVFCAFGTDIMYRVPNAWAKYGWTNVDLKKVRKDMLMDALNSAYCFVAPPALTAKYNRKQAGF